VILGPAARAAAWSGVLAGVASVLALTALLLFYAIQVPHLQGGGQAWGTNPGASLGDASDVIGIFFEAFLIPLAILLWWLLPGDRTIARGAVIVLGVLAMGAAALAGSLMVTRLLSEEIASIISGVGSVLIAVWIGLYSLQAAGQHVLPRPLTGLGMILGVAVFVSAIGLLTSLALPRTTVVLVLTVVAAVPGGLAYMAIPVWVTWAAVSLVRMR
jgi:hypothetical protein